MTEDGFRFCGQCNTYPGGGWNEDSQWRCRKGGVDVMPCDDACELFTPRSEFKREIQIYCQMRHRRDYRGDYRVAGLPAVGEPIPATPKPPEKVRRIVEPHIYFIAVGDLIKIGFSTRWRDRVKALAQMNPLKVDVLGVIPTTDASERNLHVKFAHLRRHGEWFSRGPDLLAYISENAMQPKKARSRKQKTKA